MARQSLLQKIIHFFLTKIIIGITAVVAAVALIEWAGRLLLNGTSLSDNIKNSIVAFTESVAALAIYIFLFRLYEKRKIKVITSFSLTKEFIAEDRFD